MGLCNIETGGGGGRGLTRAPKRAMALRSPLQGFLLGLVLLFSSLESLHGAAAAGNLPVQHSDGLDYPYADSYASDWSNNWDILSGRHNHAKCIDIPTNLSLCRNIGYNQMRLPNLLDHDTLSEVVQQAGSWVPLLGIHCHPDTKLFLCSLFSPVCLDRPIWPCRSLCNSVKTSCIRFMTKWGFPWPDMLRCDKFPLDNDLCIGLQNEQKLGECSIFLFLYDFLYFILNIQYVMIFCSSYQKCHRSLNVYYSPEVRRGKYWRLGIFLLQYFPLVKI